MEYREIIEQSIYSSFTSIADDYGVNARSLAAWVKGAREPREINRIKLEEIMDDIKGKKKMERHPSFGWAYPEQIKRLNEIGICPERARILEKIAEQTRKKGKVK